jgi:hypothetical protein
MGNSEEDANNWPTKPSHNSNLRTKGLFDQNSETAMFHRACQLHYRKEPFPG